MATIRKAHICKTETCGSVWYTKDSKWTKGTGFQPVWKCVNCNYTEPRKLTKREVESKARVDAMLAEGDKL